MWHSSKALILCIQEIPFENVSGFKYLETLKKVSFMIKFRKRIYPENACHY